MTYVSVFVSQNQELCELLLEEIVERCQNHLKLFPPLPSVCAQTAVCECNEL